MSSSFIVQMWSVRPDAILGVILIAELNHHIRNAVTLLGQSADLPDGPDRSRLINEAVDRVDRVLTELVPTADETDAPRLFLKDRPAGKSRKREQ